MSFRKGGGLERQQAGGDSVVDLSTRDVDVVLFAVACRDGIGETSPEIKVDPDGGWLRLWR